MLIVDDVSGRIRQLMFIVDDISRLENLLLLWMMLANWRAYTLEFINRWLLTGIDDFEFIALVSLRLTTFSQKIKASLNTDKFRIRTPVLRLLWMMLAGLESLCSLWMMLANGLENLCWLWIMLADRLDAYAYCGWC